MSSSIKKVTYRCSPLWWGSAVLALALCTGLGWYYYDTKQTNKRKKRHLEQSILTLTTEVAGLYSNYSDAKVKALQDETERIHASMMTRMEVDAFISGLRPVWSVTSRAENANEEYVHHRYQIAQGSAPVSAWDEIKTFCEKLKGMSAVSMDGIEIQTVGDSRKREFSRITLNLSIYVRKS